MLGRNEFLKSKDILNPSNFPFPLIDLWRVYFLKYYI
jgi:hypothetical protein